MSGLPGWPDWWMAHAELAATKSKDSTKVGAALIDPKTRAVLLTAFNGPPMSVRDLAERRERPAKYLFASHAEANLIAFAARLGIRTEGKIVVCTHFCCSACARALIQAGIEKFLHMGGTTSMPEAEFEAARAMLFEAGVWFNGFTTYAPAHGGEDE